MTAAQGFVIVTGATGAIGREIAIALCLQGFNLILACRNIDKANILAEDLRQLNPKPRILTLPLDLSSRQSVAEAARQLAAYPIYGLINNAGIMNRKFTTTSEGQEMTIEVNYANTAEFTRQVIEHMRPEGGKIVFTTSITRLLHRKNSYRGSITEKEFSQLGVYGLSKRLITDYAKELSQSLPPNFIVNCADPGVVDSGMITMHRWFDPLADIFFRPFIRNPKQGAIPALRAFAADSSGHIYCLRATHQL